MAHAQPHILQLTNGEDLGDSGITFAYSAWKKLSTAEKNLKLPGLNYTE
jgi:hypothetical protein